MPLKQPANVCFVLGIMVLAGCGFSQAQTVDKSNLTDNKVTAKTTMIDNDTNQLVPVSAVKFNGNKLQASVISFGCTTSSDFIVEHAIVNGLCEIKINRVNRDLCRRAPFVSEIELDWSQPDECSDLKVIVANPLLVTSDDNTVMKRLK